MSEAEYEKLVIAEALEFERRIDDYADAYSFKEGVKWSRTHPPPEVVALREFSALQDKLLVCYRTGARPGKWLDRMMELRDALARFKERTAGDEGES